MELLYYFTWLDLIPLFGIIMGIVAYKKPNIDKEETKEGRFFVKQQNYTMIIYAIISAFYLFLKCWFVFSHRFLN